MKAANTMQNIENEIFEPDFRQGDADAKPPIASQEKETLSFFTLEDIPEVFSSHWLVKGVIPLTGLGIIYGEYASGKTFFVIDLAMAIASGKNFFGRKVKQRPVLYFCLEGKEGFINRLAAWKKEHKIYPLDFKFNTSGFDFFNLSLEEISQFPKNSVIIIDTLNATDHTIDENSSSGMGKIISRAKEIQEMTNGLILFIHHCGKDAAKGARGHSSLMAAADVAIMITNNGIRNWKIAKNKDGKSGISGNFNLKEIELGIDEDGEAITSCVIEPCETPKKDLPTELKGVYELGIELCNEAGINEILTETWRLKTIEKFAQEKSNKRNYFFEKKKRLLLDGLIAENDDKIRFLELASNASNTV